MKRQELVTIMAELQQLQNKKVEISQRLVDLREQGDLSMNSEYQNAKEEERRVYNRISEIETMLANIR